YGYRLGPYGYRPAPYAHPPRPYWYTPRPYRVRAVDNVLRRPEISAALDALLAGRNTAIPVGSSNTPVPATEFAGLLANLLGSLAKQPEVPGSGSFPGYLLDPSGQLAVDDPSDPDKRAGRLLELLA